MKRSRKGIGAVLLLAILWMAMPAGAEDEPGLVEELEQALKGGDPEDFEFAADYYKEYLDEPDGMVALSGRIRIARGDFELDAPNGGVVLWVDSAGWRVLRGNLGGAPEEGARGARGALGTVIREVYAEGDVTLRRDGDSIVAKRLYYDFAHNRAVLVGGEILYRYESDDGALRVPIIVKAERIRQLSLEKVVAGPAHLTTCDFGEPHYALTVDRVVVTRKDGEISATTEGNVLKTMDAPILWLPWMSTGTGSGTRPLKDVNVGLSSTYGIFVEALFGGDFRLGNDPESEPIGEWWVLPVFRSRRGPGLGAGIEYAQPRYRGVLEGFYQRDHAGEDQSTGTPVPNLDRGRARLRDRHILSEELFGGTLIGIADTTSISDRNFLREYFPEEALEGKEQETAGYLSLAGEQQAGTLTGRWRVNNFETVTEYLPRATWDLFSLPVLTDIAGTGTDVLLSAEAEAGRVYRQYDDALPLRGELTDRALARGSAAAPFSLGPFRIRPEIGGGLTSYRGGQHDDRADAYTSIRASMDLWRVFPDATSDLLQIAGIRHISDFSLAWVDRFRVSVPSDHLVVQDPYDLVNETQAFDFRFRNRLETKRSGAIVDWIDLELRTVFFPEDTPAVANPLTAREEWELGMSSLLLPEEEVWRHYDQKGFGPLTADFRMKLRDDLIFTAEVWYDLHYDRFRTYSEGLSYEAGPDLSLFIGHRAIDGDSSILTGWAEFRMTDTWDVRLLQQTDFTGDSSLVTGLALRRLMHDFIVEVSFRNDLTRNDFSFNFSIEPRIFYEAARKRRSDEPLTIFNIR
jgi:hypothetical protein